MTKSFLMVAAAGLAMASAGASAQDRGLYVQGTFGAVFAGESSNSARISDPFEAGLGVGTLPEDTVYLFDTDFELGTFAAIALGKETVYGPFRSEIELSRSNNGIDEHGKFQALGQNLDDTDFGLLLGSDDPTGIQIGRVLEDGKGDLTTYSAMINGFYDIPVAAEAVKPYVGLGIGVTRVKVDYSPSGIEFVDDKDTVFGYQVMAGVDYDFDEVNTLHAGVRYRGTGGEVEVSTQSDVISSNMEVDVDLYTVEIGWRRSF